MSTPASDAAPQGKELTPLTTTQATFQVAEREIMSQVRSKAFLVSLAITVVVIFASIIIVTWLSSDSESESTPVAVVQGTQINEAVFTGPSTPGGLERFDVLDAAAGEELLRDGVVEAVLSSDPSNPVGLSVTALDSPPIMLVQSLSVSPTVHLLEGDADDGLLSFLAPLIFGLAFMMLCLGSGAMIVQSTVQEKQSRIVEILLASISSRSLLAGKILGNSAVAIGQAVIYALAAVIATGIMGSVAVLTMFGPSILWFFVFFVPGFVLVASMFAASGALVSRQEDAGNVMTPTMMLIMAPYFLVIFFRENDLVMTIASYVPFTAPVAMPVRLAFDNAQWWEAPISLAVLVLTTIVVMAIAARIYQGALLHSGQRMKVSDAFRSGKR